MLDSKGAREISDKSSVCITLEKIVENDVIKAAENGGYEALLEFEVGSSFDENWANLRPRLEEFGYKIRPSERKGGHDFTYVISW